VNPTFVIAALRRVVVLPALQVQSIRSLISAISSRNFAMRL
jgi:hypothetical protein